MTVTILTAALIAMVVLAVGGASTKIGSWYGNLKKPSWNPPNWVFGPAWTIILGLAAWSGVLAWSNVATSRQHLVIAVLFAANIVCHMLWSPLFFNMRRPDLDLIEVPFLWLSILALMGYLSNISSLAVLLLLPYLIWVSFAFLLNLKIVQLNRPFGRSF